MLRDSQRELLKKVEIRISEETGFIEDIGDRIRFISRNLTLGVPQFEMRPKAGLLDRVNDASELAIGCKMLEGDHWGSEILSHQISSFSTTFRLDDVPMWLAYGEAGKGFALHFPVRSLTRIGLYAGRVLYDEDSQRRFCNCIRKWMDFLDKGRFWEGKCPTAFKAKLCLAGSAFLKSASFQFEEEFRVISIQPLKSVTVTHDSVYVGAELYSERNKKELNRIAEDWGKEEWFCKLSSDYTRYWDGISDEKNWVDLPDKPTLLAAHQLVLGSARSEREYRDLRSALNWVERSTAGLQ